MKINSIWDSEISHYMNYHYLITILNRSWETYYVLKVSFLLLSLLSDLFRIYSEKFESSVDRDWLRRLLDLCCSFRPSSVPTCPTIATGDPWFLLISSNAQIISSLSEVPLLFYCSNTDFSPPELFSRFDKSHDFSPSLPKDSLLCSG